MGYKIDWTKSHIPWNHLPALTSNGPSVVLINDPENIINFVLRDREDVKIIHVLDKADLCKVESNIGQGDVLIPNFGGYLMSNSNMKIHWVNYYISLKSIQVSSSNFIFIICAQGTQISNSNLPS